VKLAFNLPTFVAAVLAAGMISQLSACGQTGPLYLPPKPKALSTPAQPPKAAPEKSSPAIQEPAPVTK
jgi:predicted small lipoprotein YifL